MRPARTQSRTSLELSPFVPCRETQSLKLAKLRGCTFVNQYVVIKYLGRGACGRVFLCMDMEDNRLYAVKVRPQSGGFQLEGAGTLPGPSAGFLCGICQNAPRLRGGGGGHSSSLELNAATTSGRQSLLRLARGLWGP